MKRIDIALVFLGVSFSICLYFYFVIIYGSNIPDWDDYDAVLGFMNNFLESKNIKDKLKLLISQHNEHRIVTDRFFILLLYYCTGAVNFKILNIIGNAFLISILYIFFRSYQSMKLGTFLYFLPIPFVLLRLDNAELMTWAMASIQNFGVLALGLVSLWSLTLRNNKYIFIPSLLAVITTYTSANGLSIFLVGMLVLLILKKYKNLLIWSLFGLFSILLYFRNYVKNPGHPDLYLSITDHPDKIISHFLYCIGSSFYISDDYGKLVSLLFGLVFTLLFAYLIMVKYYKENLFQFASLSFILLSASIISVGRSGFGVEQAFSERYRIYSILITCIYLLIVYDLCKSLKSFIKYKYYFSASLTLIAIYLGFFNYYQKYNHFLDQKKVRLEFGAFSYYHDQDLQNLSYPNQKVAVDILMKANSLNYYRLPEFKHQNISSKATKLLLPDPNDGIEYNFEVKRIGKTLFIKNGWAFIKNQNSKHNQIYVVLRQKGKDLSFRAFMQNRPDVTLHYKSENYDRSGFSCTIDENDLSKGQFEIGIYIEKKIYFFSLFNIRKLVWTNYKIDL